MEIKSNRSRTWAVDEDGRKMGEIDHPILGDSSVTIHHTEVDPAYKGQGVAGAMMENYAEQLRKEGRRAIVTCSYAKDWFNKHPEYSDVLMK
ncbi:MAG: GNAT family N-acetyltransferase [Eubacteriales bacterium]|nr:GNAT family N-acetyltransferase [Eubacteriales bacterium]